MENIEYRGHIIRIEQETDAENPYNEQDMLSDVVTWMQRYEFSSKDAYFQSVGGKRMGKLFDSPEMIMRALKTGELVYAAPIYAYIHSGITINLGEMDWRWPDKEWDCGLAGFVYMTKEKAKAEFPNYGGRTLWLACEKRVKSEVEVLDQWLTGDVWYYSIQPDEETQDGCEDSLGWIYGYDYAIQEAKSAIDYHLGKACRQLPLPGSHRELAEIGA